MAADRDACAHSDVHYQLGLSLVVGNVLLDQLDCRSLPSRHWWWQARLLVESHWWGAELFLIAVLGCVMADLAWFVAGRHYGNRVMKMLCWISLTPGFCVSDTRRSA